MIKRISKKLVSLTVLMAFMGIAFHGLIHDHSHCHNHKIETEDHHHSCGHNHHKDTKISNLHIDQNHDCSICQWLSKLDVKIPDEPFVEMTIFSSAEAYESQIDNRLTYSFYSPNARGPPTILLG